MAGAATAPLVGMVPRGSLPTLPSRHLGLVTAEQANLSAEILDQLADACEQHLDVSAIVELAERACMPQTRRRAHDEPPCMRTASHASLPTVARGKLRLGIARDEAFHFYYADNLESLARAGVEWVPFSPLADARLPADLDGLYFGGGYPEVHAARLGRQRGNARRRPRSSPPREAASMPSAAG